MTNAFKKVNAIVHANAHSKGHHGKGVDLQTNIKPGHHGIAKHGNKRQGKDDAKRDGHRTKGDEAQKGDRTKERKVHPAIGGLHHLVGGSHNA